MHTSGRELKIQFPSSPFWKRSPSPSSCPTGVLDLLFDPVPLLLPRLAPVRASLQVLMNGKLEKATQICQSRWEFKSLGLEVLGSFFLCDLQEGRGPYGHGITAWCREI